MSKSAYAIFIFSIIVFAGCSAKQANNVIKTAEPFVDECSGLAKSIEGKSPGWKLVLPVNTYDKGTIFDYIDGAAELYFAYDYRTVAAAEYQDGQTSIMIDVYDMTSPDGAFGVYSLNRYKGANYVSIGNEGILSGAALDFWKGRYFCKVYSFDMSEKYQAEVKNMGNLLAWEIQEAGSEPSIIKDLPENGLIPKSAKFFTRKLGMDNIHFISEENVLGLSENTEGVVADYDLEGHKFQLFIIHYPSSNEANSAFKTYKEFLKKDSGLSSSSDEDNIDVFESNEKFSGIYLKDQSLWGFWDVNTKETAEFILQNLLFLYVPK